MWLTEKEKLSSPVGAAAVVEQLSGGSSYCAWQHMLRETGRQREAGSRGETWDRWRDGDTERRRHG